jgi:colanic acid/amylovoran biosynthesis glycosyltransferase
VADPKAGTVALFSTRFLPYSQTFVYDEIRAHRRYDVEVFCKERLNEEHFPFDPCHKPPNRLAEKIYESTAYWPSFGRTLESGDYALVHAHFGTGAVYALPYVKNSTLPLVVTFHGNDVSALIGSQRFQPKRWRYVRKAPKVMQRADLMLGASIELCEFLVDLSGRPDAVRLYQLGVDLTRFTRSNEERKIPEIIMIARFTEKKGHEFAVRAFAETIRRGRSARLTLVGTGALEPAVRRLVEEKGLSGLVSFAGVLSPSEIARQLAVSDIALVPSVVARDMDRESGSIVAKEAAAAQLPVIGTRHGGIPEIVENEVTGFLVPERNVDALADRLVQLIDSPELCREFGRAGRRKMEREYDLFKQVQKLEAHYDTLH